MTSASHPTENTRLEGFLANKRRGNNPTPHRPIDGGDLKANGFRADKHHHDIDPLTLVDRENNPVDEWGWVETKPNRMNLGVAETIFALSNGYLGMRGNPPEGRDSQTHGTYINGVYENWKINHAEDAYGLARDGQSIIDVPDAKAMRLYIDDEPLRLGNADVREYRRSLDFRDGVLRRHMIWRTPGGKKVRVTTERMVSFQERHLAIMSLEVELLDDDAAVVVSSQLLNRQDGEGEFPDNNAPNATVDGEFDPRKGSTFSERVLVPKYQSQPEPERATLGYQVNHSGMTVGCSMDHVFSVHNTGEAHTETSADVGVEVTTEVEEDVASVTYHVNGSKGTVLRIEKFASYHSSRHVAPQELAFRCDRTINRAKRVGFKNLIEQQKEWLAEFWKRSDVKIEGQPELQQAVRWNLFQLIQASARAETTGVPAKGLTGAGYGGHYFWDTEIYVMPFLSYTNPKFARNALRFRYDMLPAAKERALELAHDGVLFPWRTINGHESSAYYAAGTAQYHIDADVAFALMKYVYATGDFEFLRREGAEILLETARFWMSIGFFNSPEDRFEIHAVTGPDEYTTVVNNNLYTNVMAQYNLRIAAEVLQSMRDNAVEEYGDLVGRHQLEDTEIQRWERAAEKMYIPFNEELGVNPQDDFFLNRQIWNLDDPNDEPKRPLLLHYHPLTIYRYQILKQADVVLALFLQGQNFSTEVKRADYNYYDLLTTGDSTLSAVVQSIMAAELGYTRKAMDFFHRGLFVDLANLHNNTPDGAHIASCGGVWSALVYGFGGLRDYYGSMSISPRLPEGWESLSYTITLHGVQIRVTVRPGEVELVTVGEGQQVGPIWVMGEEIMVTAEPVTVTGATQLTEVDDENSDVAAIREWEKQEDSRASSSVGSTRGEIQVLPSN